MAGNTVIKRHGWWVGDDRITCRHVLCDDKQRRRRGLVLTDLIRRIGHGGNERQDLKSQDEAEELVVVEDAAQGVMSMG